MNPIDNDEEREVFARFGLALYMAQVLEHEIVNTLMILRLLPSVRRANDQVSWDASVDAFMDTHFTHTFGTLIKVMDATGVVPDSLLTELRLCKAERDFLAHSFFREYAEQFFSSLGKDEMLARTDAARERFSNLNRALEDFSIPLAEKYGVTREAIAEELAQDLARLQPNGSQT